MIVATVFRKVQKVNIKESFHYWTKNLLLLITKFPRGREGGTVNAIYQGVFYLSAQDLNSCTVQNRYHFHITWAAGESNCKHFKSGNGYRIIEC